MIIGRRWRDCINRMSGAMWCGGRVGVGEASKCDKAVTKCFLSEKDGDMIVRVTGPFEFHTQEMRDFTHEVHRGEGVKLFFKSNFSITVRAKVNKVVYI